MTADTYSNTLGYLIMGTGNDNNIWGTNANSAVFQILEDAIANALTSTVTGGTLDLSGSPPPAAASQTRYATLVFNGTLGSNQLVKVPNLTKRWQIQNATSGAFALQIQTPSGSPILIPQGMYCDVWCDGSNNLTRVGAKTGQFVAHGATSPPAGAVINDGAAYSRSIYSELYNIIGTTWGAGNGTTTFNVPNTQNTARFLRSSGAGLAVGTYQANKNLSHTHTGNTGWQSADHSHSGTTGGRSAAHTHSGTTGGYSNNHSHSGWTAGSSVNHTHGGTTDNDSPDHAHAFSGTTSGESATHTHPNAQGANVGGSAGGLQGAGSASNFSTGANSNDHSHTYTGTTYGANARHQHTFTTGGFSADHTHGVGISAGDANHTHDFSTGYESVDHTHNVTTGGVSVNHNHSVTIAATGDTEARPESAVVLMCIWF